MHLLRVTARGPATARSKVQTRMRFAFCTGCPSQIFHDFGALPQVSENGAPFQLHDIIVPVCSGEWPWYLLRALLSRGVCLVHFVFAPPFKYKADFFALGVGENW